MSAGTQSEAEFLEQTAQWFFHDDAALSAALPEVYSELRQLAAHYLRGERVEHTLQPTALVHEAYLHLREQRNVDWANRGQILGVAARMMRRILVTHATARNTQKRGSGQARLPLDEAVDVYERETVSAVEVNRALEELEAVDLRQAQIAELRFFGGLTIEETADALSISPATVKREWNIARLWLERSLG